MPRHFRLSDLPEHYRAQAVAQLDAMAARRTPTITQPDTRLSLVPQARYPPLLDNPPGTLSVRIVRVGGRPLDDDNLAGGCKELRDAIAAALGRRGDSKADGLHWEYRQEPGTEPGTRIEITTLS